MSFLQQRFSFFHARFRSSGFRGQFAFKQPGKEPLQKNKIWKGAASFSAAAENKILHFLDNVKAIGSSDLLSDYEIRKLRVFNLLNFLCLVAGILVPLIGLLGDRQLPASVWFIAFAPALVSIAVLLLNYYKKYEAGMVTYFVFYPVITSFVYINGINLGVDLFFILYGILSVFFIPRISDMLFSIGLSMVSYFMLSVVLKHYNYKLETANFGLFLFNQGLAILFIFYGLFLIKKENTGYQSLLLNQNDELQEINKKIEKQKLEIAEKATLLEEQTIQLKELNALKNKLFSVISHDLKAPMYALRNLFQSFETTHLPEKEISEMLPEIVKDLNYTTGLMENLLQWGKTQMQSGSVHPTEFDISETISDVLQPMGIVAKAKKISLYYTKRKPVFVYADRDMISLVLRNLISNAIKFTHSPGTVQVEVIKKEKSAEIFIRDTGVGMTEQQQKNLFADFVTTPGTANESGTGLGLLLCKEFLAKNGSNIFVQSEENMGSIFCFTLKSLSE